MKIHPSQSIGQIAVSLKESIPLFEKHKIDYFTQGSRSLEDACYLAGIGLEAITQELDELMPVKGEWYAAEKDWSGEPMVELVDHIVTVHHAYTRGQLDRIEKILEGIGDAASPEIPTIRWFFRDLSRDLRAHMLEEEDVVFPYLIEVEKAVRREEPIPQPFKDCNPTTHPIRILQDDHGIMGREWAKIEKLTQGFALPPDAPKKIQELYQAFRELEKDNQKHIHLENNVLFHRAAQLGLLKGGEKNEDHHPETSAL